MSNQSLTATHYARSDSERDLRIDFLRGLIMIYLITVHLEFLSALSVFAWERLGLVSSAEGFVLLSGLVVGMVYRKKSIQIGAWESSILLWKRAWVLYRTNIIVIFSIATLSIFPFIDTFELTHWTSPWTRESFALFPPANSSIQELIVKTLLLEIGPHQYQIIGLYVILLGLAPSALYLLTRGKTRTLILISWVLYIANNLVYFRLTGARYELAFPTLTWQLLFFNGMVIGFHREIILNYIISAKGRWLYFTALLALFLFAFIANNNQSAIFWPWGHLNFIDQDSFKTMYVALFEKTNLGIGRVLNNLALFTVAYVLLTNYWSIINKWVGWLLIPLGQNSLYAFTLHVYFILLIYNTGLLGLDSVIVNTVIHLLVILSIWLMIKNQVLFRYIPR